MRAASSQSRVFSGGGGDGRGRCCNLAADLMAKSSGCDNVGTGSGAAARRYHNNLKSRTIGEPTSWTMLAALKNRTKLRIRNRIEEFNASNSLRSKRQKSPSGESQLMTTCCLLVAAILALHTQQVAAHPDANRLYEDLMMTYNRFVRPVQNDSKTLTVKLGLRLSQLIDVNLKNQMMTTNVWLDQEWNDYKLKWDPSEYGGIQDINLPAEQIWLPDIALYNSAEGYFAVSIMTKAKVQYDGHVTWNPPAIFRSSCQIDITYFPFDSQNCHLKFGSWTYGTKIDLRHINDTDKLIERGTDLSEYYQNVEWDIMQASAKRNVITYNCCPNDFYPDVTFNFTLRRKPLFYTVNLILPCVGITILSFLVFYLPSDSGEKVTLTISILVSLIFFLSVLIETIPSTSLAMPLLGKYLVFTMILITLSVCATVCVLNIHFRTPSTHNMPPWLKRWCIDILPKYLFMNVPHYQSQQANVLPEQLIYLHNQAYACQSAATNPLTGGAGGGAGAGVAGGGGSLTSPESLLQNYLSPVSQFKRQQQTELLNHVASLSMEQADESQSSKKSNSKRKSKGRVKPSEVQNQCSLELDARKLLQKQMTSSDNGTSSQLAASLAAAAGSSSLFLPYLQSEAARRLQLQRSRSSDRDNRSASENINMATLGAAPAINNANATTANAYNTPNRNCDTSLHQQQQQVHPTNQTTINIQSASEANSSLENSTSGLANRKESRSFFGSLFKSKKRAKVADGGETGGPSGSRRESRSRLRKGSRTSAASTGSRRDVATNGHHEDDEDDDDNGYADHDYQHHRHFQARASVCSTNMWRIGPTRRCSMAVPANYPTYYRPLIQIQPHVGHEGVPGGPLNTVSGCGMLSGHQHHIHTGDYGGHDQDDDHLRSGAAVGALATAAVGSSLIRPKQSVANLLGTNQDLRQANQQQPLVYNRNPQQNPSGQMRSSTSQTINLLNPQTLGGQQTKPFNQFAAPNLNCPTPNMYSPMPNYNQHQQHHHHQQQQQQQQQQAQMPRSRSTDYRLSSIYASTTTNTSTDLQVPTPPAPLRITSVANQPPRQLDPQVLQQLQWQARHQPVSRSSQGQAQMLNQPTSRVNAHLQSQFAQESLSIGRALGQAYMQRLQRQPAISMIQNQQQPARIQQQRQSRSLQRGEQSTLPPPPPMMNFGQPGLPLAGRNVYHLTPIQSMDMEQTDRMRRSRSYGALNQQQQHHQSPRYPPADDVNDCSGCHSMARQTFNQVPLADCCGQPTLTGRPQVAQSQRIYGPNQALGASLPPSCCLGTGGHYGGGSQMGGRPASQQCNCHSGAQPHVMRQQQQQQVAGRAAGNGQQQQQQQLARRMPGQPNNLELIRLISEVDKAIQNAMFIAQHIDNLDEFESVKENWKYIAMVIDRIFLIIFLFACITGTLAIFAMVPWSYYTTEKPIDLHLAKLMHLNLTGIPVEEIYSKSCQEF